MADSYSTLADLLKINDKNVADFPELSDVLEEAPLFGALYAEESSHGHLHKYTAQATAPVVGFRAINTGRDMSVSTDRLITVNLAILDATFAQDLALAKSYPAAKGGIDGFMAREAARHLKSAFFAAEKQFIKGTGAGGDAAGFTGLEQAIAIADGINCIKANAAAATDYSSVWFLRSGESHVSVVFNGAQEAGGGINVEPYVVQQAKDGTGKSFTALYQPILGWLALAIGGKYDVMRLANISGGAGNTLDDDLLFKALNLFPANMRPTHIAMNRRSREQLRNSRTATNATGSPAPTPMEFEGIPIVVTEAITNNEAVVGD